MTILWPDPKLVAASITLFLVWLVTKILKSGRREPYLPPGPPTIPVLGNLHLFPSESPQVKFTEWGHEYGDIYSLKISSGTAVVINSMEVAKELMDRRSAITADRPKHHMVNRVTDGLNLAHAQYLLFGKRCPRYETPESTAFFESMEVWNRCLSPGAVPPVDLLPFLDYIPSRWAWWKGLALETREKQHKLYYGLLDECEQRVARGEENGSYMEGVLVEQKEMGLTREMVGYLGGVLLEAGSDTTSSFLKYLIIALIAFPRVQRKAQEEIDRVVGHERIPTLQDIENLPYIRALIKEVIRIRPVVPLVPHGTLADMEYRGFMIPKGTMIFVNTCRRTQCYSAVRYSQSITQMASIITPVCIESVVWEYRNLHGEAEHFDNPETFDPERYVLHEYGIKEGVDPNTFRDNIAFGYGRRSCPGIHLAENSINLNTMNFIWAFNFELAKDNAGNEIKVDLDHYEKGGLLPNPLPFQCQIIPRNESVPNVIKREFKEATETFVKFERDLALDDKQWVDEQRGSL
ncbi:hypothetical protein VNI00_014407 [Paramarasmius palmivorus]|uniref:Cytochrome P450 n=1 Tax=Paramarasmius palmivorus TaxID=297713 RepID=A0AAW0BRS8_9AGAR